MRRSDDVRHEKMVVKPPNPMGARRFKVVGSDQLPNEFEITRALSRVQFGFSFTNRFCKKKTHGSITPRTMPRSSTPGALLGNTFSFHRHARKARKLSSWPVP